MTFLEKLKEDVPNRNEIWYTNQVKDFCPHEHGYKGDGFATCKYSGDCDSELCTECWNREMPNTEPNEDAYKEDMNTAYNKGLNDGRNEVWELLDKLSHAIIKSVLVEVFGYSYVEDIIDHFTPQEALAKLKAYEETQSKVVVGDIVVHKSEEEPFNELLVTCIYSDGDFDSVQVSPTNDSGKFGGTYSGRRIKNYKKTGKHIDISSILEQIGE